MNRYGSLHYCCVQSTQIPQKSNMFVRWIRFSQVKKILALRYWIGSKEWVAFCSPTPTLVSLALTVWQMPVWKKKYRQHSCRDGKKAKTGWKFIFYPTIALGNKENGNLKEYTVFVWSSLENINFTFISMLLPNHFSSIYWYQVQWSLSQSLSFLALLRGFGPPRKYIRTIWYVPGATQVDIVALLSVRDIYQC